jgi:hypothetical protein
MRNLILIAVIGLGSCVSAQERQQKIAAEDDAKCKSYGLQYGTSQYAECRMRIDQQRAANGAAAYAAFLGYMAETQRQQQPTTTSCNAIGSTINCRSY